MVEFTVHDQNSSLSRHAQQVVWLAVSRENACEY